MSNFDVRSLYCHLSLMVLTELLGQCLYAVGSPQAAIFVQIETRACEESGCADIISVFVSFISTISWLIVLIHVVLVR